MLEFLSVLRGARVVTLLVLLVAVTSLPMFAQHFTRTDLTVDLSSVSPAALNPDPNLKNSMQADWPLRRFSSQGAPFTIKQWLKNCDLAPKTKGNIRNVMSVIFKCAMHRRLVNLGVIELVRIKGVSHRRHEPRILNRDEIQALVSGLTDPCRTAVIFALRTGLRCSELFALK